MKNNSLLAEIPMIVKSYLRERPQDEIDAFVDEYRRRRKTILTAYLFLPLLGWHYAYLGKWGLQILCWLTLWGLGIWWLVDWIRLPFAVESRNREIAIELLNQVKR